MSDINTARASQYGGEEVVHGAITKHLGSVLVISSQHLSLRRAESTDENL